MNSIIRLFNQDTANIYEFYKTKAKIDIKQTDLRYANYAISAVPLSLGQHLSALFHALRANTTAPYGGVQLSRTAIAEVHQPDDLSQSEVDGATAQGAVVDSYRRMGAVQPEAETAFTENAVYDVLQAPAPAPTVKHYAVPPEDILRLEMTSPAHTESLMTYLDEFGIEALARLFKSGETVESLRLKLNQRLSEGMNTQVSAEAWNTMAVPELVSALEVHGLLNRKVSREKPLRSQAEIRASEEQIKNQVNRFASPSRRADDALKASRQRVLESMHHDNLREGAGIMKGLLHCSLTWDELGLLIPSSNAYKLQALKDLSEDFGTDIQSFLQAGRPPLSYQAWLKLPVEEKLEFAMNVSVLMEGREDDMYTSMSSLGSEVDETTGEPLYEEVGPALDEVMMQFRHEEWMQDTALGRSAFLNDLPDENGGFEADDKWS